MKLLVTGANGFIGKNLCLFLQELGFKDVSTITRADSQLEVSKKVKQAEFIFHLAGVNRPKDLNDFEKDNCELTRCIVEILKKEKRNTPILLSSSIQAGNGSEYGNSKAQAEDEILSYYKDTRAPVYIYRLPNVFGKWCRPNYNSVVATFCFNIANDLPVIIHDSDAPLSLVYVDDVCTNFIKHISEQKNNDVFCEVAPLYKTTVGELNDLILEFKQRRQSLFTDNVGEGFERALYATYISYFSPDQFKYPVKRHVDKRGAFVEMIKTKSSGQVSYFTAGPGVVRGGHYHHTKSEKFLVLQGRAKFSFKHVLTDEICEEFISGDDGEIIETIPGWIHDVTNIGDKELIIMLWANEVFDPNNADTYQRDIK